MNEHEGGQAFRRMLGAQGAHAAGDALVAIALANTLFFDVPIGEARGRIALYLLLTMAPFVVLSPVVGPLLDRTRGAWRASLIVASGGRAVLALFMATRTTSLTLYPLAFLMLVLSRTHGVSRAGGVPSLLPPGRSLLWANARLSIASVAAGTVAGMPGFALQRVGGSGWTLRLATLVFVGGAITAATLPRPDGEWDREMPGRIRGVHRLLAPRVLAGGALAATSRTALGFFTFFLAFALRRQGEGTTAFVISLIMAGAGTLIGSLLAPALRRASKESVLLLGSVGILGASAFALSARLTVATAAIMSLVCAVCVSAARLGFDSLVQRDAPEEVRGRTFARYETLFQLCWVAGAAFGTAIPFGPRAGMRMVAVICLVGFIVAVRGALKPPPPDADPPAPRA